MALVKCDDCGQVVSDKATSCPRCGRPIGNVSTVSVEVKEQNTSSITLIGVNGPGLCKVNVEIWANGQIIGIYPFEAGFEKTMPVSPDMEFIIRYQGVTMPIKLTLNPQESYVCKVYYSAGFYYKLQSKNGNVIKEDKLGIGMWILCFLIPLVGIIYFFVKRREFPIKAKNALIAGVIGFFITLLFF